ncbi:MAG: SgcJ/EcaC family oxidoreductase [Verrucomicrobia bacterium]|nr:SgcJ/EcaC family oxidoreductase [Verrucomicrobiota bacterium]
MNQDIVNVIQAYETALNASDTEAAIALYGEDPIFMPQYSAALNGRDAVRLGYDHVFNTLKLNVTFTVHEVVEMGDLAYVRTTSAGKTEILAKKTIVKEGNNELFIFRKEQGHWKIHRYLFASTNPPAAE